MEEKDISQQKMSERGVAFVTTLGIIFDPMKKKILICKRVDPYMKELIWCFPGSRIQPKTDLEKSIEISIKRKTGLEVKSLGSVHSRILEDDRKFLLMYFLCEMVGGLEEPTEEFAELKWVDPEEVEDYFGNSFDQKLKEYILGLK